MCRKFDRLVEYIPENLFAGIVDQQPRSANPVAAHRNGGMNVGPSSTVPSSIAATTCGSSSEVATATAMESAWCQNKVEVPPGLSRNDSDLVMKMI